MIIAGTRLTENDVAFLVAKLRESGFADLAGRLGVAYALDTMLLSLSTDDCEAFVSALDDCPDDCGICEQPCRTRSSTSPFRPCGNR